jgi:hypothetical protein
MLSRDFFVIKVTKRYQPFGGVLPSTGGAAVETGMCPVGVLDGTPMGGCANDEAI